MNPDVGRMCVSVRKEAITEVQGDAIRNSKVLEARIFGGRMGKKNRNKSKREELWKHHRLWDVLYVRHSLCGRTQRH